MIKLPGLILLTATAAAALQVNALPFAPVQTELFSVPNSLSNAWGDYDNDGDLDLAVSIGTGEIRLYRNDQGVMTTVGAALGMPQKGQEFRGLSWGDYDGDGFLDLMGGATEKTALSVVMHNERGTHFTDVAAEIGLTIPDRSARQSNWVDYDNDGDLDLYSSDRAGDNKLFRNDNGHFTRVFANAGPTDGRATVGACWFDADDDGDLDLFLANQAGGTDALWRNDITSFTDIAPAMHMTGPHRTADEGGVGCAVGDFDNDGDLDVFVPNYGHNQLYRRNADKTFTEIASVVGVGVENHAVGSDWGDYDNDGDLDLSVMSYVGPVDAQEPMNALFRNDGGKFVNVLTKDSPLNVGDHGVQLVDFDGDGGLDINITRGYTNSGGHFLFRNTLPDATKRRSLSVTVLDSRGHHTRFGSEVRLRDANGRILATRLVPAGGGYNSQGAGPVDFGLTSMAPVTVEVTFMSKSGRGVQTMPNISPATYLGKSVVVRQQR